MERNELYPIFLKVHQLNVLIVGGGNVGLEKLSFLLKFNATSILISSSSTTTDSFMFFIKKRKENYVPDLIAANRKKANKLALQKLKQPVLKKRNPNPICRGYLIRVMVHFQFDLIQKMNPT